jgi:hypothetical protein
LAKAGAAPRRIVGKPTEATAKLKALKSAMQKSGSIVYDQLAGPAGRINPIA